MLFLSAVKILLIDVEKGWVFQKLGRWLEEPYHIQVHSLFFYYQLSQLATAQSFQSVQGATLDVWDHPVASHDALRCLRKQRRAFSGIICFVFNVDMSSGTDQTATTAVCMLISSAFASCVSLSSFSIKGSLKQSLSTWSLVPPASFSVKEADWLHKGNWLGMESSEILRPI